MKEYKWCIISFFDILGFGERVKKQECREIYKILKYFLYQTLSQDNLDNEIVKSREIKIVNF